MRARPVANSTKSTTPLPSASKTLVIRVSRRPSLSAGKRASSFREAERVDRLDEGRHERRHALRRHDAALLVHEEDHVGLVLGVAGAEQGHEHEGDVRGRLGLAVLGVALEPGELAHGQRHEVAPGDDDRVLVEDLEPVAAAHLGGLAQRFPALVGQRHGLDAPLAVGRDPARVGAAVEVLRLADEGAGAHGLWKLLPSTFPARC